MASLGEAHIDAIGGMKLVKPLFLVLRQGGRDCKAAALRALQHLTTDPACRAAAARVRPLTTDWFRPAALCTSTVCIALDRWLSRGRVFVMVNIRAAVCANFVKLACVLEGSV